VSATAAASARAFRFVAEHGDEASRARAAVLIGSEPLARAEPSLARWAEASGVFAGAAAADPVAALPVLGALFDLRALDSDLGRRLAAALARAQAQDGSFGRSGSDEEERVFATGRLAGWLAGLRSVRRRLLDGAADFLAARFAPERVGGFAWHPLAAYAACFANVAHERADEILQWCGRELERGFRARRFDAVQTARILLDCSAASLPGAQLDASGIRLALLGEQAGDGSWPAPGDGDTAASVARTLDGLAALARLA
jgi:hypothetical protein